MEGRISTVPQIERDVLDKEEGWVFKGRFFETPLGAAVKDFALERLPGRNGKNLLSAGNIDKILKLGASGTAFIHRLQGLGILSKVKKGTNCPGNLNNYFYPEHALITGIVMLHLDKGYNYQTTINKLKDIAKDSNLEPFLGEVQDSSSILDTVLSKRRGTLFLEDSPWREFPLSESPEMNYESEEGFEDLINNQPQKSKKDKKENSFEVPDQILKTRMVKKEIRLLHIDAYGSLKETSLEEYIVVKNDSSKESPKVTGENIKSIKDYISDVLNSIDTASNPLLSWDEKKLSRLEFNLREDLENPLTFLNGPSSNSSIQLARATKFIFCLNEAKLKEFNPDQKNFSTEELVRSLSFCRNLLRLDRRYSNLGSFFAKLARRVRVEEYYDNMEEKK